MWAKHYEYNIVQASASPQKKEIQHPYCMTALALFRGPLMGSPELENTVLTIVKSARFTVTRPL